MEDSKQQSTEYGDVATTVLPTEARNLEGITIEGVEPEGIVGRLIKQSPANEKLSEEDISLMPATKIPTVDITKEKEIIRTTYKTIVEAEFIAEQHPHIVESKSSEIETGQITAVEEIVQLDRVRVSAVAEESPKKSEDIAPKRPTKSFTPSKQTTQHPSWREKISKFIILGLAHKLKIGYPPDGVRMTKAYDQTKCSKAGPAPATALGHRSSGSKLSELQTNKKKKMELKITRSNKGDVALFHKIKRPRSAFIADPYTGRATAKKV